MYNDPQSITLDTVATDFNRVGSTNPEKKGVYATSDGMTKLAITQNVSNNRFRREVRLDDKKVATHPIDAVNKEVSSSIVLIIDEPRWGYTDAELKVQLQALLDWAAVSTNVDQLLGGEF